MPGATLEPDQHFYDMDISCWEKVTNLNMNGTVYPSMIFGKVMAKQKKGCIINVSSMAAYSAITRVPGYSAAKTAVANFTQWLASEMALKYGVGIRVNAIAPGFFIGDVKYITDDADYIVTVLLKFSHTVVQLLLTNVNSYNFCSLLYKVLGNISAQYTTCSGNNSNFTGNTK